MGWALVVGASDGIGAAFAAELAARGSDLILVARRAALLDGLADFLRAKHSVDVRTIAVDAATPDGVAAIAGVPEDVELLVCNAALGPIGAFLDLTPAELDAMLDLNCRSTVHLSHSFGTRMAGRGRGGIILLSSMASYQGAALVAHYAATKAYLRVLAEGLWAELRPHGVDVLACCPGLVATPTFARTNPEPAGWLVPAPLDPRAVARESLAALGRQPVLIPGWRNRLLASASGLLPRRRLVAAATARTRAMYPPESGRRAPEGGASA
jgi:short-subunit dehydrogenase